MRAVVLSRTLHKWLALIVGVQLALWTLSGFYMVVVDLDFIHGDPLVRNLRVPLVRTSGELPIGEVARRFPAATQVSLRSLPGFAVPLYDIATEGRRVLLDATTGRQLSPLPAEQVRALARAYYAGAGGIRSLELLERDPPSELGSRPLPLWRVDFDDGLQTSLYIHPDTGTLVTRRHRFWRWFDFLWSLHIMDYKARENINNSLLRGTTLLAATTVLSGVWLLYFSFRHKLPFRRKQRGAR
jgi:uncharacterized iron-regulated membrane protein